MKMSSFRGYTSFLSSKGFTLLEVLISIVVLALGLLAVAAMQVNSLQSARNAYYGTIATLVAKDMKERLWADLTNPSALVENEKVTCPPAGSDRLSDILVQSRRVWAAIPEDINDVVSWREKLPGIDINIVSAGLPECEYIVEVSWRDDATGLSVLGEQSRMELSYYVRLPGRPL